MYDFIDVILYTNTRNPNGVLGGNVMNIDQCTLILFSPTGGTERIGKFFAENISGTYKITDVTPFCEKYCVETFSPKDIVIFAVPVFAGRVPYPAINRISNMRGNDTPCVVVAVYGNRAYEDALIELSETVQDCGFTVIGGFAAISEHSIVRTIGAGRPDQADYVKIALFADKIVEKIKNTDSFDNMESISVLGNPSYKTYKNMGETPVTEDNCIHCMKCVSNCPNGAIDINDPTITYADSCITCMRCINLCPVHARHLSNSVVDGVTSKLEKVCSRRSEPDFFI